VIIFGSVRFLSKKVTKQKNLKKKTKTELKPGQTDRCRVGSVFLGPKPVQIGLTWFFRFGLILARLGSIFPVSLGFFRFGSVLAWFGSVLV
jgi:hypothetical protein